MESTTPLLTSRELASFDTERSVNSELDREISRHLEAFPRSIFPLALSRVVERLCYALLFMSVAHLQGSPAFPSSEFTTGLDTCLAGTLFLVAAFAGATVADSFLGKFTTILLFSISYMLGIILLITFSAQPMPSNTLFTPVLLLIIGTGGIAPCTPAFNGDQFIPFQSHLMDKSFSMLYGAGVLGMILAQLSWNSPTSHIGTGLVCLILSLAILGLGQYRAVVPQRRLLAWKIISLVSLATFRRIREARQEHKIQHWLTFGLRPFSQEFIGETRLLLKVFGCTLPTCLYWMLYAHVTSECFKTNSYSLCLYITLGLVPILAFCVYPLLEQNRMHTPIMSRIIWGYFILVATSLITAATPFMPNNLQAASTVIQVSLLSLSQAIVVPSLDLLAYSQTGRQLKTHSATILIFTATLGKMLAISLNRHVPAPLSSHLAWIYPILATVGLSIQLYITKHIYISLEDELIQEEIQKLVMRSHPDWSLDSDPITSPTRIIPTMY
ncbi:hypothetical protein DSO57_1009493 [Entomophthora muscae]|uniref:Uncharacterized protein n=1 Tax=Entomophthora muscae TaxID=34485 RepID=A0ACC2UHD5_9FUNG|nr:hypothetical protein DSO57_1009493 [Entomophthora muscae]